MKRHLIPGGRDRHGIAHPLPQCTGGCLQGRTACDCMAETELACDIGPDDQRVIQPPPALPDDIRARAMRRVLVLIALGFALLGALLGISDPRFTP